MSEELFATVDGPKGSAEIFEVSPDPNKPGLSEYEVRFQGRSVSYKTLGEAYIEAGDLSGSPT